MNIIKITLISMLFTFVSSAQSQSATTLPWNIVIYMEASGGKLYQAAFKNLNEMARNAPDNAHIFAFVHTQNDTGWLYQITKNNLHKITDIDCDDFVAQTIIDVMTIAVNKGPAERHALIFWNHGYGILDPVYDEQLNEFIIPYDGPYNVIKRSPNSRHKHLRGICVTNNRTFLSNEGMVYALDVICNELLNGNKLAFCGMDICNGAMFEHAYQLRDYTDYLIASQEIEMLDGWTYDTMLQIINDAPYAPAREIAIHAVDVFRQYYEQYTEQNTNTPAAFHNLYTLSALDVRYAHKLKHNIDAVSDLLMFMMMDNDHVKTVLKKLRQQCNTFYDAPMYCDLQQWYSLLFSSCDECSNNNENPELSSLLQRLLLDGLEIMSAMTVAHCNGSASRHAHGSSIYFPQFAIDVSYLTAPFAQESSWVQFLEQFLA